MGTWSGGHVPAFVGIVGLSNNAPSEGEAECVGRIDIDLDREMASYKEAVIGLLVEVARVRNLISEANKMRRLSSESSSCSRRPNANIQEASE
ncbi:hypothetical protein PIB30_007046 [Stylosanthes scabra]|uniref:Uncharacterized protein n=1 Tax=Stylosanthes scabra TaxID=79078 RepID=A0ABU6Q5M4_9FABA|nr:hypothetical protein [Stylosanthes scabra]